MRSPGKRRPIFPRKGSKNAEKEKLTNNTLRGKKDRKKKTFETGGRGPCEACLIQGDLLRPGDILPQIEKKGGCHGGNSTDP